MTRFSTIAAASLVAVLGSVATGYAAPLAVAQFDAAMGEKLTLAGAQHLVREKLAAAGQRNMRPGHAEFDEAGNVAVEILNLQGTPVSHVIVRADNGMVTDARTGKTATKG